MTNLTRNAILFSQPAPTPIGRYAMLMPPMKMPAFRTRGSTGPAPNTVWMSTLADRLTMLINGISGFAGGTTGFISFPATTSPVGACNFANQFFPVHTSFGGFVTAPDGTTNTAQKIVEDGTNNLHYIEAGIANVNSLPNTRMAGIFKAAERTRIAFYARDHGAFFGVVVGFDLAGGQIAYGPSLLNLVGPGTGNPYVGLAASMVQVAPGYWLCMFDYTAIGPGNHNAFDGGTNFEAIHLDNGAGTAAASLTYVGNGTSGVYGWKCSTLPVQAWNINNTVFFDDFNDPTLANVDLNSTFADGFDWYLTSFVPGYYGSTPLPSNLVTQSSSSITLGTHAITAPYFSPCGLSSWGNPGDGRAHGAKGRNVHAPPVLFEAKMKFPFTMANPNNSEVSLSFFQTVEFCDELSRSAHVTGAPPYLQGDGSIRNWTIGGWAPTWGDVGGGTNFYPVGTFTTQFITQINPAIYSNSNSYGAGSFSAAPGWGIPQWIATHNATQGYYLTPCFHVPDAHFYYNNVNVVLPEPPTGASWQTFTYPPGIGPSYLEPAIFSDQTAYHVYTTMILPYDRVNKAPGTFSSWVDGVFTGLGAIWDPNQSVKQFSGGDSVPVTTDWQQIFWVIQTGYTPPNAFGFTLDSAKVMR